MPPDVLPALTTPQPAGAGGAGPTLPNQAPNPDDIYSAAMSPSPAPAAGAPNPDDVYNQSMGNGAAAPTNPPNYSMSGAAGARMDLAMRGRQPPPIPGDLDASTVDLAKVHSSDNLGDQLKILQSLHPGSKPMIEGGVLTYEHNGTRIPFDGFSLNPIKDLAQWSGQGINFISQGLTQLGMTGAGALLGPVGGVVGYEASLPTSAYLGVKAQDYLKQKWAKLPPDESQFKEDVQNAMRFNIISGNVLPAAAAGLGFWELKHLATQDAPRVLEGAIKGFLESINGKPLDIRSGGIAGGTSPTPEAAVGSKISGFFNNLHKNISDQIDKYIGQAISDSKGQTMNIGNGSLGTFNRVLREAGQGPNPAVTLDKSGYAVSMPAQSVNLSSGGSIHFGVNEPFGVPGQGSAFANMVAKDYNTILAAHKTATIGGIDLQNLNEMTQKYQKIAFGDMLPPGVESIEGVGLDSKLKAQAAQISHDLSEDRLKMMQKFISDPDAKNAVEGVYRNYSQKIDAVRMFNQLGKQSQMNPTSIVNSLFTEQNAPFVKMLKDITSDGVHENVFNDLRTAWTNKAINNSLNADGSFNASLFKNEIQKIGNDNMATMFSPMENVRLRADTALLGRFQALKPTDKAGVDALSRLVFSSTPLKTVGKLTRATGIPKLLNMLKTKPGILDAVAGEGMDNIIANSSLRDAPRAVKLKSYLKNFAQTKGNAQEVSIGNQAVRAMGQPLSGDRSAQPQPSADDVYNQSMGSP